MWLESGSLVTWCTFWVASVVARLRVIPGAIDAGNDCEKAYQLLVLQA